MIEVGHERVTLHRNDWRWWVWIVEDVDPLLRRRGVARGSRPVTPGVFRFARGGRAEFEDDARYLMEDALRIADRELAEYAYRPTHALGSGGELIPLGAPAREIER